MSGPQMLPDRLQGRGGFLLRLWEPGDAESLGRAVAQSLDHVRPWLAWAAQEPLAVEDRATMIVRWEREWRTGGDAILGVFLAGEVVGGCGLHRRVAADGLEIGYWIHRSYLRRGFATHAAALLTDAALLIPGITHVEIRHDKANRASAGVPAKLGYRLIEEVREPPVAPAEEGISCRWRMTPGEWSHRHREQSRPLPG